MGPETRRPQRVGGAVEGIGAVQHHVEIPDGFVDDRRPFETERAVVESVRRRLAFDGLGPSAGDGRIESPLDRTRTISDPAYPYDP